MFDHVTPLVRQLHWLSALWRINFELAVLAFKCLHGLAPSYLADELHHPAAIEFKQRVRSASSPALSVPRNPAVNLRRPSLPGRRRSGLEQSSSARHIRVDTLNLSYSSQDTLLQFSIFIVLFVRACEVNLSLWTR